MSLLMYNSNNLTHTHIWLIVAIRYYLDKISPTRNAANISLGKSKICDD